MCLIDKADHKGATSLLDCTFTLSVLNSSQKFQRKTEELREQMQRNMEERIQEQQLQEREFQVQAKGYGMFRQITSALCVW